MAQKSVNNNLIPKLYNIKKVLAVINILMMMKKG